MWTGELPQAWEWERHGRRLVTGLHPGCEPPRALEACCPLIARLASGLTAAFPWKWSRPPSDWPASERDLRGACHFQVEQLVCDVVGRALFVRRSIDLHPIGVREIFRIRIQGFLALAFFAYLIVPPGPRFPEHLHMKTVCGVVCAYCGDPSQGEAVIQPLREFGPPLFAFTGPMPYPVRNGMFDALLPPGLSHYWKSDFINELTGETIKEHVEHGPEIPTVNSAMHIYPLDGAVHDVGADETAFAYRNILYTHIIAAVTPDPAALPGYREWVRNYWNALHPHSAGGAYVNFLMEEGDERIAGSYTGNYARLAKIKAKYDPGNVFCVNQNIKPAA